MNKQNELDELLSVIQEEKHDNIDEIIHSSVVDFCASFDLQKGTTKISRSLLYKLYTLWFRSYKKTGVERLKQADFIKSINLKFGSNGTTKEILLSIPKSKLNSHIIHYLRNESPTKKPEYSFAKKERIERFLTKYDLVSGDVKIHCDIIYYLYDLFCYDNNYITMNKKHFNKIIKLYLNSDNAGIFYLNSSIYKHVTKEQMEEILTKGVRVKENKQENLTKKTKSKIRK